MEMNVKHYYVLFIVLIILVALIGTMSIWGENKTTIIYAGQDNDKTISVSGSAEKDVTPDEGYINFTVETQSEKAETAQTNNAEIWDLIKLDLDKLSYLKYETQSYNVYPNQEWDKTLEKYVINGYKVNHTIKLTLSDISKVGEITDLVVKKGVNNIDSVSFGLKKETQESVKKALWALAFKDAKSKATEVVDATGASLNNTPKTITIDSYNYYPPIYYSKAEYSSGMMDSVANTDITPKELEVSVSLSVLFSYE